MTLCARAGRPVREHRPAASRRLLLTVAVLVLGALLPGTASAAPERGFLVVEGQGGTTTEFVHDGSAPVTFDALRPELRGGGAYAGLLVEALQTSPANPGRFGAVQVRAFADRTRGAVALLGADGLLEPGRYRVTLLGQGAVKVRYALDDRDAAGIRVVPRTRIPVTFLGRAEMLPAGRSGARIDFPRALGPGRRALQVVLLDGVASDDLRMCASADGSCEQLLPACPPAVACDQPGARTARVGLGEPTAKALLHLPAPAARSLTWSIDGFRDVEDRLRGAAIVF